MFLGLLCMFACLDFEFYIFPLTVERSSLKEVKAEMQTTIWGEIGEFLFLY